MIIELGKNFKKHFKQRISHRLLLHKRTEERIRLFKENPSHSLLHDHPLAGTKKDLRAFSITGDIRIIYRQVDSFIVLFLDIGTHNQVYK